MTISEPKKIRNIVAFLAIMLNEDFEVLMRQSPSYILEKFDRYCESSREDEYEWGMHPILKRAYDKYCERWGI